MINNKKLYYLIIPVLLFVFVSAEMQNKEELDSKDIARKITKAIKDGNYYYQEYEFSQALEIYSSVYSLDEDNLLLNLKIGLCYLYSTPKPKSLQYFKKTYEIDPEFERMIYFYLGRSYQLNYEFENAIVFYNKHNESIKKLPRNEFIPVTKRIEECHYGIVYLQKKCDIKIENLGEQVNSPFPEYRPLISIDESLLLYTSKRGETTGSKLDPFDDQFYEDIYSTGLLNGKWKKSKLLDKPINTLSNDAISGMSYDGKSLILYNDNYIYGDLYISEYENKQWSVPERLPTTINSRYIESTSAFSVTKDTLYFVSERTDISVGLKDIYMSVKDSVGNWTEAKNLGSKINTKLNEEAISIHPNGKAIYFSSEGHSSMGGYDVFVSYLSDNGEWSEPINLGYPLNTPDDDLFFTMSGQSNVAYYSAYREDGFGNEDLYKVTFNPEELFALKELKPVEVEDVLVEVSKPIDELGKDTINSEEVIALKAPEGEMGKLNELSIEEIFEGLEDEEVVDIVFDNKKLKENFEVQKKVMDRAKLITTELIKEDNGFDIEILKKNPTKVIVEVINTSSSKGMDFMYPSGGEGTFVMMLPELNYSVSMDIEDISTVIGKSFLVSSDVKKQLISNNIIAVTND